MDAITKFLNRDYHGEKRRIAVVGDSMLDEYFYVNADRVSPEFPIPVMQSSGDSHVFLGGASNVCRQFQYFNASITAFTPADKKLEALYSNFDITVGNSVTIGPGAELEYPPKIPLKKRFYQGQFPLCRWDVEEKNYGLSQKDLNSLQILAKRNFEHLHSQQPFDVLILSDYGKGMFSDGVGPRQWLNPDRGPITIVDPKTGPIEKWKDCTIIKLNHKEAEMFSGETNSEAQCDFFKDKTNCTAVVITRGGEGVACRVLDNYFEYHPTQTITPESVIGAGDCFIAVLSICMARQMDIMTAVEVAFEAGAIYVQKKHNTPVSPQELRRISDPIAAKFVSVEYLKGRDLAFTNGGFDILHIGHMETLRFAKSKAHELVVAVNTDEYMMRKAPGRPIIPLKQRMDILAALEFVDYVIVLEEDTPYNLIKSIGPKVLVKGADWEDNIVGSDLVKEVYVSPMVPGVSTTQIVNKIREI